MPTKPPIYRFAPSPNGELHLGHAFSAILNFELANRCNGRFLLRIEDIDTARSRPEFIEAIIRDLKWLGLQWEEPIRIQSDHFGTYRAALAKLEKLTLLYPCFATRKEISDALMGEASPATDPDGALIYPGIYKNLSPDEIAARRATSTPYALRLDMKKAIDLLKARNNWPLTYTEIDPSGTRNTIECIPADWGDVVIARKDVPTSYHLSVTVDDAIQKISHVVRGRDLQASTDIHRMLQALLDLPCPTYHHHHLINDEDGAKLSKSAASKSLRILRNEGVTPDEIWENFGLVKKSA